jgi:hypothetical protein
MLFWYSGVMRGAVAFALAFQVGETPHASGLQKVVLVVVMVTSLAMPLLSRRFLRATGFNEEDA